MTLRATRPDTNIRSVAHHIATVAQALKNCGVAGNDKWSDIWYEVMEELRNHLPSGSGFDSGTLIQNERCDDSRLTLVTGFHHMDEHGYDGWTHHRVIVRASLTGNHSISVSGPNRNAIKDHVADTVRHALDAQIDLVPIIARATASTGA